MNDEGRPPDDAETPAADELTDAPEAPEEERAEPPPAEEEPRRIWDPNLRRWLTPDELTTTAPPERREPAVLPVGGPEAPSDAAVPGPRPAPTPAPRWVTAIVAGAVGAVLAVVAMLFVPGVIDRRPATQRPRIIEDIGSDPRSGIADQAREARPWVVGVVAQGSVPSLLGSRTFQRSGSGVVIREDGAVVTPARLVAEASKILVTTSAGRTVEAQLVGSDKITDVAVLRVDVPGLSPAVLGTSEGLDLGDTVVSVSAPSGVQSVVTSGSISATGRTVDPGDGELLLDMLQVDAPLASGGSGGVLVGGGSAIGMTASVGETSGAVGYAIPIDVVRSVAEQILDGKKVAHPWVGLTVDKLDGELVDGLVVATVFKDGPAEKAEMKMGDVIVGIDGDDVRGPLSLLTRLLESKVGAEMTLSVHREAATEKVKLTVSERPSIK